MSEAGSFELSRIDHVQLAMPAGAEPEAEAYYSAVLGLDRVEKPPALAVRGGCWFRSPSVEIHLGVEEPFVPARKAHVALVVKGYRALLDRLVAEGYEIRPSDEIPGVERCHSDDPFGNRIELISGDEAVPPAP